MPTSIRSLVFVSGIIAILTTETAYPNGRQPPRPANVSPIKATCSERSGGVRHEILRARIISGGEGSSQMLSVLTGGIREELALADIKRLALPTAQVNGEGFMKATVVRREGTEEIGTLVQVKSGSSKVRLAGFKSDGTAINIDLSRCKGLEFSPAAGGASDFSERPAAKN